MHFKSRTIPCTFEAFTVTDVTPFYLKQKHKNESFLIADRSAYHVSKMEIEFPSVPPQEIVVSYR